MKIESIAQMLNDTMYDVKDQALDPDDCPNLAEAASEALRVLNIGSLDIIDGIFEPAFGELTFNVLADVANDERIKQKTELYAQVTQLFYDVRNGKANFDDFFSKVLGKTL